MKKYICLSILNQIFKALRPASTFNLMLALRPESLDLNQINVFSFPSASRSPLFKKVRLLLLLCLQVISHRATYGPWSVSPVNVFSHRPAFQSFMVLSADPDSMRPCSGRMSTAHTAAVWPWGEHIQQITHPVSSPVQMLPHHYYYYYYSSIWKSAKFNLFFTERSQKLQHTCKVIMHFSLSHTLAVVSQEPLKSVPNFPDDSVQTVKRQRKSKSWHHFMYSLKIYKGWPTLRKRQLACIFVTLKGEEGLRSVQSEDTNVTVVPTCGDQPAGVRFVGCNNANARYKVRVARHTVHLCEAFVWAGDGGKDNRNILSEDRFVLKCMHIGQMN